ncbi:MAG: RDD family protein [Deltaproteobacteria bacterium]|nr:RDD family protein [Deltaproteobacteria bacterium]
MLFSLVEQELSNPSKPKKIEIAPLTEERRLTATDLETAFKKYGTAAILDEQRQKVAATEKAAIRSPRTLHAEGFYDESQIIVAPIWRRICARAIDILFYLESAIIVSSISFVPKHITYKLLNFDALTFDDLMPYSFHYLLTAIIVWLVISSALTGGRGKTLGKGLMGIEVIREDGYQVDFPTAILRTLGESISLLTLGLGLLPGLGKKHRTIHDRMAQTVVIYAPIV